MGVEHTQKQNYRLFSQPQIPFSLESLQEENDQIERHYEHGFDENGHWQLTASPQNWQAPPKMPYIAKTFRALENCMQGLPQDTARIFYLREVMGWEVNEICHEFAISRRIVTLSCIAPAMDCANVYNIAGFDLAKDYEGEEPC